MSQNVLLSGFVCLCRRDCGGLCLSDDDSTLSSPVVGQHHFRPRDLDVTGHAPGCHEDTCCVAKSLLIHDDTTSNNTTTTGGRSGSPQARLLHDCRSAVVTGSCNNVHAVVFSSKPDQQHPFAVTCDCAKIDDDSDEPPIWRLAQSPSRPGDDDVQYYVIDRRKLASTLRLAAPSASKRTLAAGQDAKQLSLRGTRTENSGTLATQPLVGECRPLLVVTPGECCRNQRFSPVPASIDNSNDSAS